MRLSRDPERTLTVPISVSRQGGASTSDYTLNPSNARLTFSSGETRKTLTFSAVDDTIDDDDESIVLSFRGTPPAQSSYSNDTATINIIDNDYPTVTPGIHSSSRSISVPEGQDRTITFTLNTAPERTLTIPLSHTERGGASYSDYYVPYSVTFYEDETSKTVQFSAHHDYIDDDDESVVVAFDTPPDGVNSSRQTSTIRILDDDHPSITVSFRETYHEVNEGRGKTLYLDLSAPPERTIDIPLSVYLGHGATASDYSLSATTLRFSRTQTSRSLTFTARNDSDNDDNEYVTVAFENLPPSVSSGYTTTIYIGDTDHPSDITASFISDSYFATEGSNFPIGVRLSAPPERDIRIRLTPTRSGGASSSDFSMPTSLDFTATQTLAYFTFTTHTDTNDETGEEVRISLTSLPSGISSGGTSTVTLSDVEPINATFAETSYSVDEGLSTNIIVNLSVITDRDITLPLTTKHLGGATSADYSVPSSVSFSSGEDSKTITFTAVDDTINDDDESITLSFTNLPNGVTGGPPASIAINDDDFSFTTIQFEVASYTAAEGGHTATIPFILSRQPERTLVIPLTLTGLFGATAADYTAPSSVSFGPTQTRQTIVVQATDDQVALEPYEALQITFGTMPDNSIQPDPDGIVSTTVSLNDNDNAAFDFDKTTLTVTEGTSGTYTVVPHTEPNPNFRLEGFPSQFFTFTPPALVFTPDNWTTQQTMQVVAHTPLTEDQTAGIDPTNPYTSVDERDHDGSGGALYFTTENWNIPQTFTYSTYQQPTGQVQLSLSLNDPQDLPHVSPSPTTHDFFPANWTNPVTITVNVALDDNALDERAVISHETLIAEHDYQHFSGLTYGFADIVVLIDDPDEQLTANYDSTSYSVAEDAHQTVTVTLSPPPNRETVVPLLFQPTGGATADDYTNLPTSLTFATDQTQQTFTFTPVDDDIDDDDEGVLLDFGDLPARVTKGNTATMAIEDNDDPWVTLSIESDSYTLEEGLSHLHRLQPGREPGTHHHHPPVLHVPQRSYR